MENPIRCAELKDSDNHIVNLDFVRGVAALLVVMQHLQCFQFLFSDENKIFNYFCSLGGDAVMVFFVLSGYLVGGSVIEASRRAQWSWLNYLVNRLSRLWMVLIPALFLTLFWDSLGLRFAGSDVYHGSLWNITASGPESDYTLDLKTFFGNVFFLEQIRCPRFGSDGPLWSLPNEFWYYIIFPFLFLTFFSQGGLKNKLFNLIVFAGLAWWLPKPIAHLAPVWLMGVLAYWWVRQPKLNRFTDNRFIFGLSLFLLFAVTFISHLGLAKNTPFVRLFEPNSNNESCLVGIAFTCMIPFFLSHPISLRWYQAVSQWLSKISYTLYLVHYPLLAFFFFTFRLPAKDSSTFGHYLLFLFYLAVVLAYAWCIWHLFERRTPELRKIFKNIVYSFATRP